MMGQSADISNICEYEWYQWVMFNDGPTLCPNPKYDMGRYLGAVIDVGNTMTHTILKANDKVT